MVMAQDTESRKSVTPKLIKPNPNNPRLYFNDDSLDQLKTSIQEVGVIVPLIVYEPSDESGGFVLLDGERRWKCAIELGIPNVPVNVIPEPTDTDNLLRMFNIHSVREEWPLISIALSLQKIISSTFEDRETRLAEMTGLTRGTVRRAKRLLELPEAELALIASEAHLDRDRQVHREDLYLEVMAAISVVLTQFPELGKEYGRNSIIRQLVKKREEGSLPAVTDFRALPKLVRAIPAVPSEKILAGIRTIIEDVNVNPKDVYAEIAEIPTQRQAFDNRSRQLLSALEDMDGTIPLDETVVSILRSVQANLARILAEQ